MNLLKNLFSLNYYTNILSGTQKFRPFLAAFFLALIVSIRPSIFIIKDVYPIVQNLEKKVMDLVDEIVPQELEVKIKNGFASSNVTEPYYLTVREETLESLLSLKKDKQISKSKVRLLAIDTKGKAEEFERYQSLALLTQTSIVYYQDGKTNIQSLRGIQDLTINRELIKSKISEYKIIGKLTTSVVLASPLILIIFGFIGQIFKFFLIALLVYLMVRINQLKVGFKNVFPYTAATVFIVMLLANIVSFIPMVASNFFAIEAILTMVILGLAYKGIVSLKNVAQEPIVGALPAAPNLVTPQPPPAGIAQPSSMQTGSRDLSSRPSTALQPRSDPGEKTPV